METIQTKANKGEHFVKGAKLNLISSLLAIPLFGLSILPFALINGCEHTFIEIINLVTPQLILALLLGILVHEGLHAITWVILLAKGYKSIKFGFNIHSFSPYTHCNIPMKVWQYRLGGLMPGLLMGVIPVIISFVLQSTLINFIGFLFLWAASGDFISLYMLRQLESHILVLDHPNEMGYIIVNEPKN